MKMSGNPHETLEERLRRLQVGRKSEEISEGQPSIPTGLDTSKPRDLQERINKFLQEEIVPRGVSERFKNVPDLLDLTNNRRAVTTEFQDDSHLADKAVILELLPTKRLVQLGRTYIPMISSGFTARGAAVMLILAANLRNPASGKSIFNDDDFIYDLIDDPYTKLPNILLHAGRACEPLPPLGNNIEGEATSYCYLAASLLRLFTKSADNYTKAFDHIISGYTRFYGSPIPISVPRPTREAICNLADFFSYGSIFSATLFRILYMGGGSDKAKELRRFLYELHLTNTGLHVVDIFFKLRAALNCQPNQILDAMISQRFKPQISMLVSMLDLESKSDESHRRKMWRYGRLFDEGFLDPLRTKSCPEFVYILAAALKGVSPEGNRGILNIVQLADVPPYRKKHCSFVGEAVVRYIRAGNPVVADTSQRVQLPKV